MQRSASYRPPLPRRPQAANTSATPDHCPFLGTSTDPGTSLAFPSDANHCYQGRFPVPISTIHQENYCLSSQYETCPVFRQRSSETNDGALLPLTAVAVSSAYDDEPESWVEPVGMAAAAGFGMGAAGAMPAASVPPPASSRPLSWEQPTHPDFQADLAASARARSRRVDARPIWIGLLLLALIPLIWWLWTTVRPGSRSAASDLEGSIVTLATPAATGEDVNPAVGGGDASAGAPPVVTPTTGIAAVGDSGSTTFTPPAEATTTDLENIAATATALFVGGTTVTECAAPTWWVAYSVEEGDTIEVLAEARGILPEELIVANCLPGPELVSGSLLYLPPVGVVVLLPDQATPTPVAIGSVNPTRAPFPPTRAPIVFPTSTLPVIIIISTAQPTDAPPTDEPATRPPTRPTTAPTSVAPSTATPPNPFATTTPPNIPPTSTPPLPATVAPTRTPPGGGGASTPTPTGTAGAATQTPPSP